MAEIFNEDEMVLLYRFLLEIEKAKNSLDLNLGPTVESGDHIVPSVGCTGIVNRVDGDRVRMNTANGYAPTLSTVNFAEFRPVPTGVHSRTFVPAHAYDPGCYSPHFGNMEARPEYWESLMNSSYAVQLQRIYGNTWGESSRQITMATEEEVAGEKNAQNIEQAHGDEGNNGGDEGEA
ncbi:hypothetical protein Bca52824_039772 [Brassica carinata]|uniref:Uncharacterized protein n=1 Tax=Brassica carinata TaxID=52824 RepID=A0A8X7RTM3_BRACI|nr:hypothetical protein Bca52824_039772 [Brassica carinata]